jgi:hypothetical protein
VSDVCSQRPGRRSRLGYLEGHPYELLVHVIPSRARVGYGERLEGPWQVSGPGSSHVLA